MAHLRGIVGLGADEERCPTRYPLAPPTTRLLSTGVRGKLPCERERLELERPGNNGDSSQVEG